MTETHPRRLHPGRTALALLLLGDLGFILIDLLFNVVGLNPLSSMKLDQDHSVPEFYQYLKLGWSVALLVLVGWANRTWQPVFWVPLFTMLLMTDAATVHEQLGGVIAEALPLPTIAGLRPRDLGELLVAATFVLPSLLLVALAWRRASARARRFHLTIVSLLALLATFGLVFDVFHQATSNAKLQQVFALLEDGGEMVAVSAILAFLVAAAASNLRVGVRRLTKPAVREQPDEQSAKMLT